MLVVVNLHCGCINVRFKRLEGIIQVRYGICVGGSRDCDRRGNTSGLLEDITTSAWCGFCVLRNDLISHDKSVSCSDQHIRQTYNSRARIVIEKEDADPTRIADNATDSFVMMDVVVYFCHVDCGRGCDLVAIGGCDGLGPGL